MDCKQAEKRISHFLNDELEGRELEAFLDHMDGCGECKEELTIQFLVTEGMTRIEEGNNFDLQSELNMLLVNARHNIRMERGLRLLAYGLELLVVIGVGLTVFLAVIL